MNDKTAVIGCGMMGSAIARSLAEGGREVVVWNRSAGKAAELAGPSITVAGDPQEAVDAASLVVLVLSTYDAARSALDSIEWNGATIANLITGTPAEAEEFATWAAERGAAYLDGAILAYPQDIGTPDAMIVVAGDPKLWADHGSCLCIVAGATRHVSEKVSAANVLDVAATGGFYTVAIGAFVEAAAFAKAAGVSPKTLLVPAEPLVEILKRSLEEASEAIETGEFETDQATLDVFLEAAEGWRSAMVDAGQRATFLSGTVENMRAAKAKGFGHLGFFAQSMIAGAPVSSQR